MRYAVQDEIVKTGSQIIILARRMSPSGLPRRGIKRRISAKLELFTERCERLHGGYTYNYC